MIIGIDINVITDFDNNVINEFIKQSKDITAAKKRIADLIEKCLFDWSSEEFSKFLNDNLEEIVKNIWINYFPMVINLFSFLTGLIRSIKTHFKPLLTG